MKLRERVLGIHDLVAPEGRVTVELLDERGLKTVKKVKADNAIMTHFLHSFERSVRGEAMVASNPSVYGQTGFHFHGYLQEASFGTQTDPAYSSTNWWVRFRAGLANLEHNRQLSGCYKNIILSDSTQAVDAEEWAFPGNVMGFCHLPEQNVLTNTKRSNLVLASCQRTPTLLRYVAEWGTTLANGTHNSVGIGNLVFAQSQPYAFPTPSTNNVPASVFSDSPLNSSPGLNNFTGLWGSAGSPFMQFIGGVTGLSTTGALLSGCRVSDSEFWTVQSGTAANNLFKWDPVNATTTNFPWNAANLAGGLQVTGPTLTTIGAGTNKCGVTVTTNGDLWLAYLGTLKRCVKPTNTTLSVTNTYTPAGIENCIDITTDGTDLYWLGATTVYKITATTGVVASSWAHGLAGTIANIAYFASPAARLHIGSYRTLTSTLWHHPSTASTINKMSDEFTVAGVWTGNISTAPMSSGSPEAHLSGILFPLTSNGKYHVGWATQNSSGVASTAGLGGPTHCSRTVLGSPVVKTSANSLRVTYEFGF